MRRFQTLLNLSASFVLLLVISISNQRVHAQFNGVIDMHLYSINDQEVTDTSLVQMFVTNDRILIKGAEDQRLKSGSYEASGLLIRQDQKDFVLMMGKNQALQLTKSEIEGFFSMISTVFGIEQPSAAEMEESKTKIEVTGRVDMIKGYTSKEIRITEADDDGYLSVWTTSKLDMNWGLLAEPWLNSPEWLRDATDRLTLEFQTNSIPVLITWTTNDGNTTTIYELMRAEKSAIVKAMVELPSNYQLLGFSDWIMLQMMQQY
ncbi:MAG: DUF4412 domain-containing protein [Bacteroidota bacterium]